jgi:hypothetical protein
MFGYQMLSNQRGMRLRIEAADIFSESLISAIETSMRTALAMLADAKHSPAEIRATIAPLVLRAPLHEERISVVREAVVSTLHCSTSAVFDVGPDASFFDLGGSSIQMSVLAKELLLRGAKITILDIFSGPSIDEMASNASFDLKHVTIG